MFHKLFFFTLLSLTSVILGAVISDEEHTSLNTRDPKFLFKIITIRPDACTTTTNLDGVCYKATDCTALGGTASGTCAFGLGVCCYITSTCGSTMTVNATTFISPTTATTTQTCATTIDIQGQNICQIRLDFNTFNIKQPDVQGVCTDDTFTVAGSTNDAALPTLCGLNTGQHMYFNVDPAGANPTLTMDLTDTGLTREWDIKVSEIPCGATYAAPTGCLQYYTELTDTVTSFNFMEPALTDFPATSTADINLHLANLNYAVCIGQQTNYCSVMWTASSETSFLTHGDPISNPLSIGDPAAGFTLNPFDPVCTDYLVIQGGVDDAGTSRDRYCGLAFPNEVTSSSMPYSMSVITDGAELGTFNDVKNTGFSLVYRLQTC